MKLIIFSILFIVIQSCSPKTSQSEIYGCRAGNCSDAIKALFDNSRQDALVWVSSVVGKANLFASDPDKYISVYLRNPQNLLLIASDISATKYNFTDEDKGACAYADGSTEGDNKNTILFSIPACQKTLLKDGDLQKELAILILIHESMHHFVKMKSDSIYFENIDAEESFCGNSATAIKDVFKGEVKPTVEPITITMPIGLERTNGISIKDNQKEAVCNLIFAYYLMIHPDLSSKKDFSCVNSFSSVDDKPSGLPSGPCPISDITEATLKVYPTTQYTIVPLPDEIITEASPKDSRAKKYDLWRMECENAYKTREKLWKDKIITFDCGIPDCGNQFERGCKSKAFLYLKKD